MEQSVHNTITKFSERYNNQVNLGSDSAREELTQMICQALESQSTPGTYNKEQLHFFSNLDSSEHK